MSPLGSVLGSGLNGGWYNTAKPHKLGGFDVTITTNIVMIAEEAKTFNISEANRGTFIAYVTNNGNSEEKVEVITPAPLRQWSVDVVPNDFKLQPGETKEIEIRVTPPVGLKDDDTYKFTIIIQPEDTPVAGEPIELIVNADTSTISLVNDFVGQFLLYGAMLIGSIFLILIFLRTRKENKMINEALLLNQED